MISCCTLTSRPFNNATRRVKLSLKSISPRIADNVIAFTSSPTPARIASSSITSVWIKVESISTQIRRRFLRNISSFWNEISMPSSRDTSNSSFCSASRSGRLPRNENSMQLCRFSTGVSMFGRSLKRRILSIFNCRLATNAATLAICRAVISRASKVITYRSCSCLPTHAAYSSSLNGVNRTIISSLEQQNSTSLIISPLWLGSSTRIKILRFN